VIPLQALWLPILLSAIFVFVVSSVLHMLSPWHKGDYPKVPGEDKVMDALRPFEIPPGDYFMPRASSGQEMRSPEFTAKLNKGPVMVFTVFPNGRMNMARNLAMWFVYLLIVSGFAGFAAARTLAAGSAFAAVFYSAVITAFLGYAVALWQMSIWYRRAWSMTVKATVDGVIYAVVTAATFGWLWPR
jgi:hypothetical protein